MSLVTYYARLHRAQLEELAASPEGFANIHVRCPPGAEVMDVAQAAPVLAWLLSRCKRIEQLHFAADMAELLGEDPDKRDALPEVPPLDPLLTLLEGRGKKDPRLDVGSGPACVFEPVEVQAFAGPLMSTDEGTLRRQLDFGLMDSQFLPVEHWQEEGEQIFSEYILPKFEKLKALYSAAAAAGQFVIVWWQ